jgi:hypothetical protein
MTVFNVLVVAMVVVSFAGDACSLFLDYRIEIQVVLFSILHILIVSLHSEYIF